MKLNHAQIAGLVSVTYVLFFFGGIFIHYFTSGEAYTLKFSLMLPSVWAAALGGLAIGWGLWHQYRWAWWLGLIGVLLQLIGSFRHLIRLTSINIIPSVGVIVVLCLFIIFLTLMLLPTTRKQCTK